MLFYAIPTSPLTKGDLDNFGTVYITTNQTITGLKTFNTLPQSAVNPVADDDLTRKKWVEDQIAAATGALDWQDSVLDKDLNTPPGAPGAGNRYIVAAGGVGAWAGHDDDIAEWDGAAWQFQTPNEGFACVVEDENKVYIYIAGTGWVLMASILDHGSLQGLANDDHTQYILANGTRAFTSSQSLGGFDLTNVGNLTLTNNLNLPATADVNTGNIIQNTDRLIHTYGYNNYFAGKEAGNYTLTGSNMVGIGASALLDVTSGATSVGVGVYALRRMTTAVDNVAVGYASGDNTDGSRNTYVGARAGANVTSGSENVLIGFRAGHQLATGDDNVFLGHRAGYWETGSNKLFIDNNIRADEADARVKALIYGIFDPATANQYLYVNGHLTIREDLNPLKNINLPVTADANTGVIEQNSIRLVHTYGTNNLFFGSTTGNFSLTGTSNTAIGWRGGQNLTSGSSNVLIGGLAGDSMTSANHNIAIGPSAMRYTTDQGANTAIGSGALGNVNNLYNIGIGYQAGQSINVGAANTVIGTTAGIDITSGGHNTLIGYKAGYSLVAGDGNVFIGDLAGYYETGSNKLFIDNDNRTDEADARVKALIYGIFDAATANQYLYVNGHLTVREDLDPLKNINMPATADANTGVLMQGTNRFLHGYGTNNTFLGDLSGNFTTTGQNNIGIGTDTLEDLTSGMDNTVVGCEAGDDLSSADDTVLIGSRAGYQITSGARNTIVGEKSGYTLTTGDSNVFLGRRAGYYETGSNKLFIDNDARASEADARVKALLYGIFDPATDNQYLYVNGHLFAREGFDVNDEPIEKAEYLELQEVTTPGATANYGKVYTKNDNKLYFQDGAGTEHEIAFV